jgi:pimeloyl-ACP methyl ester carboxylesterase
MKIFKSEAGRQQVWESYDQLVKQWGVEVEESDLETSFGTTHIIRAGSRDLPPLLLFHGVGDNSALMWVYNARELAEHFHLIAVDTIGGPGKSRPNERYKRQGMDHKLWFGELLDGLGVEQAFAAGVSMGCLLVQILLTSWPGRIKGIIGMAGLPSLQSVKSNPLRSMTVFLPEALFPTEKNIRKLLLKLSGSNASAFTENELIMRHYGQLLRHFNKMAMTKHPQKRFTAEEGAIFTDRAVFLVGDKDKIAYFPGCGQVLEALGIPHEILPDTGHGINHEQAEKVNQSMIKNLRHFGAKIVSK